MFGFLEDAFTPAWPGSLMIHKLSSSYSNSPLFTQIFIQTIPAGTGAFFLRFVMGGMIQGGCSPGGQI
jgi:hypothetical protein